MLNQNRGAIRALSSGYLLLVPRSAVMVGQAASHHSLAMAGPCACDADCRELRHACAGFAYVLVSNGIQSVSDAIPLRALSGYVIHFEM